MKSNQSVHNLGSALLVFGLGFSAAAFAAGGAGSGTSGSTGGFVPPNPATAVVATGPSAPVAQVQDASGRGAHNPVDDEGRRVNRTWVDNASPQLASGNDARNFVERDSDRFDTLRADQSGVAPVAERHE